MSVQSRLLSSRHFLPLCLMQFGGALNDNLFKNALIILITYRIAAKSGVEAGQLVIGAAGLFMLPFFLFSSVAGQLADAFEKARLIRWIKGIEIALMAFAMLGFYRQEIWMLFAVMVGWGMHVTFLGPLRYSILPRHLPSDMLLAANGWIEMVTFLALLLGTLAGGLLILHAEGWLWVGGVGIATAIAGWAASWFIPSAPPESARKIGWNIAAETATLLQHTRRNRTVWFAVLGLSWFWAVATVLLSQFSAFTRYYLQGDAQVVTLLLTMFSAGVGIGSVGCDRLLRGRIETRLLPASLLGVGGMAILLFLLSPSHAVTDGINVGAWLSQARSWGILFGLFALSVCGGVFTIPLYAMLQDGAAPGKGAQAIAANNIVNSLFIVAAVGIASGLLRFGLEVPELFLILGIANLAVAAWVAWMRRSGVG